MIGGFPAARVGDTSMHGVPVVPMVNTGGHEVYVTIFSSPALARWTGVARFTRGDCWREPLAAYRGVIWREALRKVHEYWRPKLGAAGKVELAE